MNAQDHDRESSAAHPLDEADRAASASPDNSETTIDYPAATVSYVDSPTSTSGTGPDGVSVPQAMCRFGDYQLLERIAEGGMGVVYKARQLSLNRIVAVKMIRSGEFASEREIQRFHSEAQSAAKLLHPHVVAIHEVGEHDGQHYFSMDHVEGRSLADIVQESPLPAEQAARYVKTIAAAIQYAHTQGIVHRDLKPSNVLIDRNEQPRVTDFGLAREIGGGSDLTATGAVVGTPSYMPPEQADPKRGKFTVASDVYSLGAVLYDLLTGRPPFRADTKLDTLLQVLDTEPVAPRLLNPKIPRDLETICLKCLSKEPHRRYASAQELADDLVRFLDGRPVKARPVNTAERVLRWCRRHPLRASIVAAGLVLLAALVVYWQTRPAHLDLRVAPATARVTLDGESVGLIGGRVHLPTTPGRHELAVAADGYVAQGRRLVLVRGSENAVFETIELRPNFGYVHIESDPAGASVQVREEQGAVVASGATPFHSPRLPAGSYTLDLSKDLYRDAEVTVVVPSGDQVQEAAPVSLDPMFEHAESYERLRERMRFLAEPISAWDFADVPLRDAVDHIAARQGIAIVLDQSAMAEEGVSPETRVTLRLPGGTLREGLRRLLEPLHLVYSIRQLERDLIVVVTSEAEAVSPLVTVLHPVSDLVGVAAASPSGLISSITSQCDPAAWNYVGGAGTIAYEPAGRCLSVTQTLRAHEMIDDFLTGLRQSRLAQQGTDARQPRSIQVRAGRTVIPGLFGWDLEQGQFGASETIDVFWEHQSETERFLSARNGARMAVLPGRSFDEIDLEYLMDCELSERSLSGCEADNQLEPGTVLALRTAEGNLAVLRVVAYRSLHDVDFPEAIHVSPEWQEFALRKPNQQRYHLELEWILYFAR